MRREKLRRTVLVVTALFVLGAAATAYAAINSYTVSTTFTTKKAGTAKKPVPMGFTQDVKVSGTNGNRSAVLLDLKTKIYGLAIDSKDFPTCSLKTISKPPYDAACPKKAEVATGAITATLGDQTNFSTSVGGASCDPVLDVWNSGKGKLTYFFRDTPTHQCLNGGLQTGQVGPYPGTYKKQGKFIVMDTPIPKYVDYPASGLVGSLSSEHLKWSKQTKKVKGKTVAAIASVGCKGNKRPWSMTFTSTLPTAGPAKETKTVSGNAPC
jgi:hypothetical protein